MSSSTTTSYTKLNDVVIHDEEMDLKYDDNNNYKHNYMFGRKPGFGSET